MDLTAWEDKFNFCLALEFSDPDYFRAHHILVPTYHLQCGTYASGIQSSAIELVRGFIAHPDTAPSQSQIKEINGRFSSNNRKVKITTEGAPNVVMADMTILDVRTDTASHYREDVVKWAQSVIQKLIS